MPKVVLIHCSINKQTKYILTTKADHIVHPVLQPSNTPRTPRNEMDPTRDLNQNSLRTAISCYLLLFSMLRNRMNPAQVLLPSVFSLRSRAPRFHLLERAWAASAELLLPPAPGVLREWIIDYLI